MKKINTSSRYTVDLTREPELMKKVEEWIWNNHSNKSNMLRAAMECLLNITHTIEPEQAPDTFAEPIELTPKFKPDCGVVKPCEICHKMVNSWEKGADGKPTSVYIRGPAYFTRELIGNVFEYKVWHVDCWENRLLDK